MGCFTLAPPAFFPRSALASAPSHPHCPSFEGIFLVGYVLVDTNG